MARHTAPRGPGPRAVLGSLLGSLRPGDRSNVSVFCHRQGRIQGAGRPFEVGRLGGGRVIAGSCAGEEGDRSGHRCPNKDATADPGFEGGGRGREPRPTPALREQ